MKKFIGTINGEKFDNVQSFTEALKNLDWNKPHDVRSEYYDDNSEQKCNCDKEQCTCNKQISDSSLLNNPDFVITNEFINNMSDNDINEYGKKYLNDYNNLNNSVIKDEYMLNKISKDIEDIKHEITNLIKLQGDLEEELKEKNDEFKTITDNVYNNNNELNKYKETGKLNLINKYKYNNKYNSQYYDYNNDVISLLTRIFGI